MSKRTHLSKLDKKLKRKVVALMYANGLDRETVGFLINNGTLADVADYIDINDIIK